MKLNKSTAALDYKLVTAFNDVRQQLLQPKFADRWDKPLAHWVIGSDRRLPLAFLDRSLRELLDTPFDDLFSTAGIGHKKIRTFLMLLNRAARPHPLGALRTAESDMTEAQPSVVKDANGLPVPQVVSEALWVRWRENVRKHGLEREPLGRYVGTLRDLPRVIWYKPLGDYTPLTLAQVRSLKTHGEKRVRAVLEAFGSLHRILLYLDPESRLAVRIVPRWLPPIEDWVVGRLTDPVTPTKHEIRKSLIVPLLEQVRADAGKTIARLVERRLKSQSAAVHLAAEQMGVTRARVYQLLSEAADVVNVRWPAGAALVARLREKMRAEGANPKLLAWLDDAIDLLFLRSQGRAAADLEMSATGATHRNGHAHGRNGASGTNGHRSSPKPAHQRPAGTRQPEKRTMR